MKAQENKNGHIQNTWEAPNGLKVQLLHVSQFTIQAAGRRVKMPDVPVLYDEDKGRADENPLDPDYLQAVEDAKEARAMAILGAFITFGTKIIKQPEGLMPFDSDEWPELVESLLGEKVSENAALRRLTWMKYIALNDQGAFQNLLTAITRFNKLITEGDVAEAAESFRGETGRRELDGPSPAATD